MNWAGPIDAYCERTDASYLSEPLNAVSNLAFVVAAVVGWRAARRSSDVAAQLLAVGACCIGIGSFVFHTHATVWSLQADVFPIRIFVIVYVGLAAVRFFRQPYWVGVMAGLAFVPYSLAVVAIVREVAGRLNGSVGYLPVPLLMFVVAVVLLRRDPPTGRALVGAGLAFTLSLVLRTIDAAACEVWPSGTHFLWHIVNGLVIGWMIVTFVRAGASRRPARAGAPGEHA